MAAALMFAPAMLSAQDSPAPEVPSEPAATASATYADLTSMAERSELIVRVEIRRQAELKAERAPDLAPGFARLYLEARTIELIAGQRAIGESLAYLVDVPLNEKGKTPKLKRREMVLFANRAARATKDRPAQLQLVGPAAQLPYSPAFEARLKPILTALVAPDRPPLVTGISDALAVPGTLAGESETQIFLKTSDGSPVSLTVLRRPGQPPAWGVSWGEIIDSSARPPEPQTLRWYRLACALPARLPSNANLAREARSRRLASDDYAFVMRELGECERRLTESA
ncbi:MAG: hypothetical protein AAF494_13535 [Pseudomonadota bacterium]